MTEMIVCNAYSRKLISVLFNMIDKFTGNCSRIDNKRFAAAFVTDEIAVYKASAGIMRIYFHGLFTPLSKYASLVLEDLKDTSWYELFVK